MRNNHKLLMVCIMFYSYAKALYALQLRDGIIATMKTSEAFRSMKRETTASGTPVDSQQTTSGI